MASFDVTSLFTNIPVGETIEIISNQIFSNRVVFEGLDRSQFIKLLSLAVRNCHFTFNNRVYQQIDGVALGSPLGPLFANIFMSFHEKTWLHNCPSLFKPLLYRRYVDDCFLLFKSLNHVPLFLDYRNRQHPSISFTSELEKDGKLPFLDVEIFRSSGKFSTSVYRKPTFTGLFTNFHSAFPSLALTLFKFAIKSPDFAMLLIHILTFDLFFAPLHVSLLSFLLRIKFPSL